jgi:hypothetical protein
MLRFTAYFHKKTHFFNLTYITFKRNIYLRLGIIQPVVTIGFYNTIS